MYKATIASNQDNYHHKIYYGITETKFKQRYANHIKSFRHEKHEKYFENIRHITLTPKDVPCV